MDFSNATRMADSADRTAAAYQRVNDRLGPIVSTRPKPELGLECRNTAWSPDPTFWTDKALDPNHIGKMSEHFTTIRVADLADAEALANVHVTSWREAYAGILPDQMLSDLNVADRTKRWCSIIATKAGGHEGSVFLALNKGSAVGFISYGRQRDIALRDRGFTGEIEALYVLEVAQRKGIGRNLLRQAAQHLLALKHKAAALWVLEGNHSARTFYKAMGARPVGLREDVRMDATLNEVAYGWQDLSKDLPTRNGTPIS